MYGLELHSEAFMPFVKLSLLLLLLLLLFSVEERSRQIESRLPLLVGSVMGGAAFLLVVVAIVIVFVFRT